MSPRPASPETVAVGLIAGELAVTAAGAAPPDWIKVTPRGGAKTRDGRAYSFTPETLAARFKADAVDVALDLDHAIALRASKGERVDAIGYAKDLQAREDGTYARVDWLDGGSAALAARTHRYVSPTFHHDAAGEATWLHSISLVSAPALSMPALAHALGYRNEAQTLIADLVMPRIPVAAEEYKWTEYPLAEMFTVPNTLVGRRGRVERVEFTGIEKSGRTRDYGLEDGIPQPVIIGAAERAIEPGGPGVGAARVVSEAQGFASRPLTDTAATDLGLRPRTAVEREALTEAEREELAGLRRPPTEREELEFLRRMRAPAGVVVDAADVSGRRLARVAAPILRDGVKYAPGTDNDTVPVDFAAYTELVGIGAITDTRWDHLDPVAD